MCHTLSIFANVIGAIGPKQTVSYTRIANQEDGGKEHQTTNCAWLSFQKESDQIKDYKHDVCLNQS